MAVKYKQYYQDMVKQHKELFEEFQKVHDNFVQDSEKYKDEFNEVGGKVMEVVRSYEARLTSQSIGTGYGKFSNNLSDKFWGEIKKFYPKIDFVGIK